MLEKSWTFSQERSQSIFQPRKGDVDIACFERARATGNRKRPDDRPIY
jgi:hypothetical protein